MNRENGLNKSGWLRFPCPTCGVYAGQRCWTHAGDLRPESHTLRKLATIETEKPFGIENGANLNPGTIAFALKRLRANYPLLR